MKKLSSLALLATLLVATPAFADDTPSGNWGAQAADSVAIGGDKLTGSEKSSEKSADKKVLNNDVSSATTQ